MAAMARRILILAVLVAALGLVGLVIYSTVCPPGRRCFSRGPKPPHGAVVFLGDSITSGHGLPLETTFPARLGETLGVPTVNAGISGDRTAGGLARLERDVLTHRPRLVVVELGVNDMFSGVPRADTIGNLRAIVKRIRATGAGVVLVHFRLGQVAGDGYRADMRALARDEGATLAEDLLDGVVPELSTDGLHPDAEGHARLAERLAPVLRPLVTRR
jgi:acyl-CoA thioesterase-1